MNPIDRHWLFSELHAGRWILPSVGTHFRHELLQLLSQKSQSELKALPTCVLSAAFYRNENAGEFKSRRLPSHPIMIVDEGAERVFWNRALKELVGSEARLAAISASDLLVIDSAVSEILEVIPELKASFDLIDHFVFYESSEWAASSQPHYFGAIFLKSSLLKNGKLAETIVHELAHQELFGLNLLDRLVAEAADEKRTYAPFQRVERPTIGRLHAAHALYRVSQFYARAEKTLDQTICTFDPGDLTELGSFLLDCYRRNTNFSQRRTIS